MNPTELLAKVADLLWGLASSAVASLTEPLATLQPLTGQHPALQDRLYEPLANLPDGHPLLKLAHDMLGNITDANSPVRAHGWLSAPNSPRGVALVMTDGNAHAVLAVSPGPKIDVVVTAGAAFTHTIDSSDWALTAAVQSQGDVWSASYSPGAPTAATPGAAVKITAKRRRPFELGDPRGPRVALSVTDAALSTGPGQPLQLTVPVTDFQATVLPAALADILGGSSAALTGQTSFAIQVTRAGGMQFSDGGVSITRPVNVNLPAVSTRRFGLELDVDDSGFVLRPTLSAIAKPPGLPLSVSIDGVALQIPIHLGADGIGVDINRLAARLPTGMGVELGLGVVSGGGAVMARGEPGSGAYAGAFDVDLGVVRVQAFGLLQLPVGGKPFSLLVLLGLELPYPGIQLSFGFALDAVGGLIGINRRVDQDRLRGLVLDGNADRILFPGNAVARANEIASSLETSFPVARGRAVLGPMVRINWGGRLLTLSAAVILDTPDPVQTLLLGRLVIAIPDPIVPLIRLQANVFGKIDPGLPSAEFLATLNGSWIVGRPLTGELYLLMRGGSDAVFVLSAGGFHPKFARPAGVPALRRLSLDIGGGVLGLRAEAYMALTSNSLQFGAKLALDATIAGCGVEGQLGLDALFVWEPALAFSVRVYASVAVLAFGERLAGIGLDFTLEGPAPWHAFGTGSISVLFWDVSLDFDERWGDPPAVQPKAEEILPLLRDAINRADCWTAERAPTQRSGLRWTDEANKALAKGDVAQPDSTFRLSQKVVPLETPITRFHRVGIPEQSWRVSVVERDTENPLPTFTPVPRERFVPGEYFAMTEDDQLSRPAFQDLVSGSRLSDVDIKPGTKHVVDDTYETGYKVEEGWFAEPPPRKVPVAGIGIFWLETFARQMRAAERVDRWQAAQRPISTIRVVMQR